MNTFTIEELDREEVELLPSRVVMCSPCYQPCSPCCQPTVQIYIQIRLDFGCCRV